MYEKFEIHALGRAGKKSNSMLGVQVVDCLIYSSVQQNELNDTNAHVCHFHLENMQ